MRTVHSSGHLWGVGGSDLPQFPPWVWAWTWSPSISPLGVGRDLIPFIPPWVWAWTWSPSISPLSVGLDLIPLNFPPWVWAWIEACCDTSCNACWDTPPLETCCKACVDTSCNACWDTPPSGDLLQGMRGYLLQCMLGYTPPPVPVDRQMPVKA